MTSPLTSTATKRLTREGWDVVRPSPTPTINRSTNVSPAKTPSDWDTMSAAGVSDTYSYAGSKPHTRGPSPSRDTTKAEASLKPPSRKEQKLLATQAKEEARRKRVAEANAKKAEQEALEKALFDK
jgi:hypothetical protein